ncbi:MAG: hypothetical protein Q9160_008583 [Pyrenula sp. 1 TL-2023]
MRAQNRKSSPIQASDPPTQRAARPGRRGGNLNLYFLPTEDNPELLLRKSPKTKRRPAQTGKAGLQHIAPDLGSLDREGQEAHSRAAKESSRPALSDDFSDQQSSQVSDSEDPQQAFNRAWGYLPPFDEETVAVVEAIINDPIMAKRADRIGPEKNEFGLGLRYRNVRTAPCSNADPCSNEIKAYEFNREVAESEGDKQSQGQLWKFDQAKCDKGTNEAFFQRTLMMGLIGRNYLMYEPDNAQHTYLDFSVEEVWTCPPMPTRAYALKDKFLTQPKPDLAVCFRRKAVVPDGLWMRMPKAMLRLACFENDGPRGESKVFHFFTVEAKRELTSARDQVAQRQCLNNASQSLFNLFEFFRDADHEEIFFHQVRVFSAVASTEGLLIRIHRAEKVHDESRRVIPLPADYPLYFEYQDYTFLNRSEFEREKVLDIIEPILIGYGVKKLLPLLKQAADSIITRYPLGSQEMMARADSNFYRYGQTQIGTESRELTPISISSSPQPVYGVNTVPMTEDSNKNMPPPSLPAPVVKPFGAEVISAQGESSSSTKTSSASNKRTREPQSGEAQQTSPRRRKSKA